MNKWETIKAEHAGQEAYKLDGHGMHHDPVMGDHMKIVTDDHDGVVYKMKGEDESLDAFNERVEQELSKMNDTHLFSSLDYDTRTSLITHGEVPQHLVERERSITGSQYRQDLAANREAAREDVMASLVDSLSRGESNPYEQPKTQELVQSPERELERER